MAVISVRLNKQEEKIIDYLVNYFEEDKSTLIKKSLIELYEDVRDMDFIEEYETNAAKKKVNFINADELNLDE